MVGMVMLTHKLRMTVRTKRQREALGTALEVSRQLYNAGLEERIGAWSKVKLRIGLHDQYKSLTQLSGDPSVKGLPVTLLRWPLKRLDLAFRGFFSRVRQKQSPGFPRFRSISRWRSFGYSDRSGWKLVGRWLVLSRIGRFHLHRHRPLEGGPFAADQARGPQVVCVRDLRGCQCGRSCGTGYRP
jgi:putative transposase